jgi:hypothetical protein
LSSFVSESAESVASDRRHQVLVSDSATQNQIQPESVIKTNTFSFGTLFGAFRLGGPDPLDYISMYANPGDAKQHIPPHWHYISFGLSDLYGDGRVHEPNGPDTPSGFGVELTFRLKREPHETCPPTWPATVMQSLAKYVFQTENVLCPGDHVSWHCSLDNSDSRIQHMLMTDDPQLGTLHGPFGQVTFIQIVGVTVEELQAAQQWNGTGTSSLSTTLPRQLSTNPPSPLLYLCSGVIDLMKSVSNSGGPFLVTDMQRDRCIFELDKEVKEAVEDGINAEGSNLSGVSAKCSFKPKISYEFVINTKDEDDSDDSEDDSSTSGDSDSNAESVEDSDSDGNIGQGQGKDANDKDGANCNKENNSDEMNQVSSAKEAPHETTSIVNESSEVNTLNEAISHIKLNDAGATNADASCQGNGTSQTTRAASRCTSGLNAQRSLMSPCKSEASSSMSVSHEPQTHNPSLSRMSYTSETGALEPNDLLLPRFFKQVHISINLEAGLLLPLALR